MVLKTLMNITTSSEDLLRYPDRQAFLDILEGFDGVELMHLDEDERGIIPSEKVIGFHSRFYEYWLDFYRGDQDALLKQFGTVENVECFYGGTHKQRLVEQLRDQLALAKRYNAEYMVLHTIDCDFDELFTGVYRHSDEEVIDALCEIINEAFSPDEPMLLLLENLWEAGFRFTDPALTKRLLDGIECRNKGIVLDTGHLMHTDTSILTPEEAVAYIHRMLDEHGSLVDYIKEIHLNQSLTGPLYQSIMDNPPQLSEDYSEKMGQLFGTIYRIDVHEPFIGEGVRELIERINPDYLTYEFITCDCDQLDDYNRRQRAALA